MHAPADDPDNIDVLVDLAQKALPHQVQALVQLHLHKVDLGARLVVNLHTGSVRL